jgi:hypothetical protein
MSVLQISVCGNSIFSNINFVSVGLKLHTEASRYDPVSEMAIEGLAMETFAAIFRNRVPKLKSNQPN